MIHMKKKKGGMRNYPKQKIWRDTSIEEIREKVYLDISIDGKNAGRLVFELLVDMVPRTCGNFSELVAHTHRYGYKGTAFFRIIPGFMCQGGDWLANNGTRSNSVFSRPFLDENFKVKHDRAGILTMANKGEPDTNGSQFIITFGPTPWLDGKNVAFGRLVEGFDVLKKIELCGSKGGKPTKRVIISRCDEISSEYYGQMEEVFGKGETPRAVRHTSVRAHNAPTNMRSEDRNKKNLREAPEFPQDRMLPPV